MKPLPCIRRLLSVILASACLFQAGTQAAPIPLSEIGAKATQDYQGDAMGIAGTPEGARLHTGFQKLAGSVTSEGLTLVSTEEGDSLKLTATCIGRDSTDATCIGRDSTDAPSSVALPASGKVSVEGKTVRWSRPGLAEEYSVSADGIRQDFIVASAPEGPGDLSVCLTLTGARAEKMGEGVRLTLGASGRQLAYSRLHVVDATGRVLEARLEVQATDHLTVRVEDSGAVYPVCIDPTFSDADWISMSSGLPGANSSVDALYPDGSGNLYFGGDFTMIGSIEANRIAKWNGSEWSSLGTGVDARVASIAVIGGSVYVGGDFTTAGGIAAQGIARWDGTTWSALGTGLGDGGEGFQIGVNALAVSSGNLLVGGQFVTAGGIASRGVARWNGSAWSGLSSGVSGFVQALLVVGGDIYVGGGFETAGAGALAVNGIARWNGSTWSSLGSGMTETSQGNFPVVQALLSDGGWIYAGGDFSVAGGGPVSNIARWNGSNWSSLGTGTDDRVLGLASYGGAVIAAGTFANAGGVAARSIAKWDGSSWSTVGGEADPDAFGIYTLAVSGGNLYAGGYFSAIGGVPAKHAARWNGSAWSALGTGADGSVDELAVSGGDLYAAGDFTTIGGIAAKRIAKWNGSTWSALGSGLSGGFGGAHVLLADGSDLYAGGWFASAGGVAVNRIAKWNGSSWSALGTGVSGGFLFDVRALAMIDGVLHVGGSFTSAGGVSASNIARWNGSTWSALGSGVNGNGVYSMFHSGGDLYVGGSFTSAGGAPANRVARWDGSAWTPLGSGVSGLVKSLAMAGGDLYAGGFFTEAGGNPAPNIARWDGNAWSSLGSGLNGDVNAIAANGSDLYAGGNFTSAGGVSANYIAKWDGSEWTPLGSGTDQRVHCLAINSTGRMFVGGIFHLAGTSVSNFVARANIGPAPQGNWIYSGELQLEVPDSLAVNRLNDVVAISGGSIHTVALRSGGSVVAWGADSFGQTAVPAAAQSGVTGISAGGQHTLALKQNGSVIGWGNDGNGQITIPPGAQSGVVAIAAGFRHSVALKADGTVLAWGDNTHGQTTIPPSAQSGVTAIAAGKFHTLALKDNGSVIAWGLGTSGQTTVPATALNDVTAIAGGDAHSLALKANGSVVTWGEGGAAVPASATSGVTAIAAGGSINGILKSDGSYILWSDGFPENTETAPTPPAGITAIAHGEDHFIALDATGKVTIWGGNLAGASIVPAEIRKEVASLTSGSDHHVAVLNDGTVTAWGSNAYGQTNIPPAAQTGVVAVSSHLRDTIALKEDGSVVSWGQDFYLQSTIPVAAQTGVVAVSAGWYHMLALKSNGAVVAWGKNTENQASVPAAALSGVTAIGAGSDFSMALKAGGVIGWGANAHGQLTIPSAAQSGVTAIAVGTIHCLALKADGSVIAWGANSDGQASVPVAALSGVTAIACGSAHSVALKADGSVVAWGNNFAGQTKVPSATTLKVAGIAASSRVTFYQIGQVLPAGLNFADANLEAGLRTALSMPSGPITASDMLTLTNLNLASSGITDLSGLETATNLRILDIRDNPFADANATWGILDQLPLYCLYTNLPRPGGPPPGLLTEAVSTGVGNFYITVDPTNLPSLDISGLGIDTTNPANLDALDRIAAAGVTVVTGAANLPPAATGTATVTNQATGATTLNGSASRDIDGTVVAWAWTWAGGSAAGGNPTAIFPVGTTTVTLTVTDDDGATGTTTLEVQVLGAPEIALEQPAGTELTGANPTVTFPSRGVGRSGEATVFTIRNSGTAALLGIVVQVAPPATDFSLDLTGTATSLAPGATTTFSILFTPSETGPRSASLVVTSNDADENPATIGLAGVGLAPEWFWTNFSGQAGGLGNADGTGAAARFDNPAGIVADGNGGFFVADSNNHAIRRISSAGVVTPFAGNSQIPGATDGTATAALFRGPSGLAMKPGGTLVVADTINHTIRQVSPGGVVTLLAGQPGVFGSQSGTGTGARFFTPRAVAVDQQMNIYVADSGNQTIRKIDIFGEVTLFAGAPGQTGSVDGPKLNARFNNPRGVAVDPGGMVYVSEWGNHTIRRIDPSGNVTTLAGTSGVSGSADGSGPGARFNRPSGIALDPNGMILVADTDNHLIRLVTPGGIVSTVAGLAATSGDADGTGAVARFRSPAAVAADSEGTFVADTANSTIRKIDNEGGVTTPAGTSPQGGNVDGNLASARYLQPGGGVFDAAGNLYIVDTGNHNIRKILPNGTVSVLAGGGVSGFVNGTGSDARFNRPSEIVLAPNGNLLVSDKGNGRIRQITPAGEVSTHAGIGGAGLINGTALSARFNSPHGMAFDSNGNLFIADLFNHVIRKLDTDGNVTTFAGAGGQIGGIDGTATAARFNQPTGLAIDPSNNLYVTCAAGHTIRRITPAAEVTTLAGADGIWGGTDGIGTAARFWNPQPIAWHPDGYLVAGDWLGHTIRRIDPSGEVTTIGGLGGAGTDADGYGQESRFSRPAGIVVRPDLSLLVMDSYNNRLVTGTPPVSDGVEFGDPLLEAAIRLALSKPTGPITGADMLALTNLNLSGLGLTDLSGLESAANLRILNIRGNAFVDPAALWSILDQLTLYCLYTDVPRPGANLPGLLTQTVTDTTGGIFFITVNAPNLPTLDVSGLNIDISNPANQSALQTFSSAGINVIGVPNNSPAARASATVLDLAARSVVLDGGSSSDTDGSIVSWAWTWPGGSATGSSPTVTLPAGVTTITLNVTDDDGASGETTLTVSLDPGLITAFVAAGLSGSDALPEATPFNDGVENLLKYAFNMNLAGPDVSTLPTGSGISGLPSITTPDEAPPGTLRVEFLRRKGSGLAYTPQKSTTLDGPGWASLSAIPVVTSINDQWERVVYVEPPAPVPAPACFGRVSVSIP